MDPVLSKSSHATDVCAEIKNNKLRTVYSAKTSTWKNNDDVQIFINRSLLPTCPTTLCSGTREFVGNHLELEIWIVSGVINREYQESTNFYLQRLIIQMGKQNSWDYLVSANQEIFILESEQTREKTAVQCWDALAFSSSLSLRYLTFSNLFNGG